MKPFPPLAVGALVLVCLTSICPIACKTAPPETAGIPNFAQVSATNNVWRSGQFGPDDLPTLQTNHIKRILKLNTRSESTFDDAAAKVGIEVRYAPITLRQQLGLDGIPMGQIIADLAFMQKGDCLVHCEHGQDRTGMLVYCYRVLVSGWGNQAAKAERDSMGFHKELRGLSDFCEDFR